MKYVKELTNHVGRNFKLYINQSKYGLYYLVALPEEIKDNATMLVESYNSSGKPKDTYKENVKTALIEGTEIDKLLIEAVIDQPIVLPITPNIKGDSDCQQLSKESVQDENIHIRFLDCIKSAKADIEQLTGKKINDKIFLNGYSASGVFAQRFAFIYPEIVEKCLIGGAAGSIPIPSKDIDYPIGIRDYEELFGKVFDKTAFKKIQYGYYVAENEERENAEWDINGDFIESKKQIPAPMHDMSFRSVTTTKDVGKAQRERLGQTMNERYRNSIEYYKELDIDISAIILRDADHGTIFNGSLTRTSPYLKNQILNFYYNGIPLQYDEINCVKKMNEKFQKTRERLSKEVKEEK